MMAESLAGNREVSVAEVTAVEFEALPELAALDPPLLAPPQAGTRIRTETTSAAATRTPGLPIRGLIARPP